ncbi:MAG: type II/IV secretion system protein [Betaproteobacteria bacterium]|nr:MAG: type II/IV secretion system protein [Betaproteobacteria bacterium]TMH41360.1 MAG: type II/IV secretion system protein [Betaproteobacteria bacterium]
MNIEVLEREHGADVVKHLSQALHMPAMSAAEMDAAQAAFDLVPYAEATRRGCVALRGDEGDIYIVLGNPFDLDTQDWLEERLAVPFRYRLALRQEVADYLARQETEMRALQGATAELQTGGAVKDAAQDLSFETISETDSPVVRLVASTLYDAIKAGASDVHLETNATGLTIKYRIDGVLTPAETVPGTEVADQVISRIKVMSELDIAERRVPQDGRFKARREGREIDFRVSVMPSVFGEDAVLRILDRRALSDQLKGLTLDALGFDAEIIGRMRQLSAEPYGMLLVTGPTGSGKTTSLYATITEVNKGLDKIITIEDPVEYQLPGVLQIPVNEQKGLTFARGLRSILRHDPDRIMVGEIRDPETAEIAVQSALTGHLVYTTVHANNAFDVLGRFMHMGVDPYNLVSALNAVLAQRLVRVFCPACKSKGCAQCRASGFRGRKAIGELLVLNDELRELIIARAPARKLKEVARAAGTLPLREAAMRLVTNGETSLEEINRVTFVA